MKVVCLMLTYVLGFNYVYGQTQSADFPKYIEGLPLFQYLENEINLAEYQPALDKLKKFEHIIHLGTGGSSLGPQALYAIADKPERTFTFFDNIDPCGIAKRIQGIDFSKTGLLVVSKSGNTAETLVQLATFKKIFEDKGLNLKDHLVIITQTDGNAMHTFAVKNEITVLPHHQQIGGRFAIFSNVGILPGLLMGLDMQAFQNGASHAVAQFKKDPFN
jgi:glucose-6-phosphate isomerase